MLREQPSTRTTSATATKSVRGGTRPSIQATSKFAAAWARQARARGSARTKSLHKPVTVAAKPIGRVLPLRLRNRPGTLRRLADLGFIRSHGQGSLRNGVCAIAEGAPSSGGAEPFPRGFLLRRFPELSGETCCDRRGIGCRPTSIRSEARAGVTVLFICTPALKHRARRLSS